VTDSTPTLSTVTQTVFSQRPDTVTSSRFFSFHKRAFLLEDKAAVQYSGSATLSSLVRLCAILTGPHDVAASDSQDTDSAKREWKFVVTDPLTPLITPHLLRGGELREGLTVSRSNQR
jgi:hypothetical protein